jgi:hypothetical protein
MEPLATKPKITNKEISQGYVTRYFIKIKSNNKVLEIDEQQFNQFSTSTSYQTLKLNWIIGGNDATIYKNGYNIAGAYDQNSTIRQTYNTIMPGLINLLPNPLEFFKGKVIGA